MSWPAFEVGRPETFLPGWHVGFRVSVGRPSQASLKLVRLILALMITRPSSLLHRGDTGEPSAPIPAAAGVFASDRPPFMITDEDGREGLVFRALADWVRSPEDPTGRPIDEWPGWHRVEFDPQRALADFLGVRDRDTTLAFATRYGPMWACTEHAFPCIWSGVPLGVFGSKCNWTNAEPLDWWLGLADRMRAVLGAAERYKRGQPLRPEDWRAMGYIPPEAPYGAGEGFLIGSAVNGELQACGVHVGLNWNLTALVIDPGRGFVGALWQQIASDIAGGRPLAVCSSCARPYVRSGRAPKTGQRNYCPACRNSAPQRFSRQTRRASART